MPFSGFEGAANASPRRASLSARLHDAINRYNSQSRFLTAFIEPGPDADGPYLRLAYHCSYPDGVTFAAFQTMAATVTVDCFSFCELIRNRALNTLSKLDQEGLNTAPRLVATRRNPSSRTTLALNMITPVLPAMPRV
jgi:hypothetical protein